MLSMYVCACANIDDKFIERAAQRFIAGEVENHSGKFMPTQAEFAREARRLQNMFRSPAARARQISKDPYIPDGPRKIRDDTLKIMREMGCKFRPRNDL